MSAGRPLPAFAPLAAGRIWRVPDVLPVIKEQPFQKNAVSDDPWTGSVANLSGKLGAAYEKNAMNCPKCGESVPCDGRFCGKCGQQIDSGAARAQSESA